MSEPRDTRSVPDLIGDVLRETTELFRTEGKLIRAEISDKIAQVQVGGGSIAAGAICLLVALVVLAQALVIALAHVVGAGWAALIVGVVIALVGVALLAKGKKDLETVSLTPDRTLQQLQKDGRLVKEQTR
ncbi:phage holin family protein [Aureimonas sp. AU12]|uniref:phage holin family protein n=1 Tax=Aureimonas sp. AU12 TaxID=1638161 RepID=UPI0007837B89|nr:phage holin family protein [Aureimonas sp. AU12]